MVKFSRYFVGLLFIVSGLIKMNDPIGFAIKLEEYFVVFGMEWLSTLALSLATIICAVEIVLGVALLLGSYMKQTSWVLLLMILFFTWLTGYSAVTGKVTDCGCFGDAVKLTPWQSFMKDIILLIFILIIFFKRNAVRSNLKPTQQITALTSTFIISLAIGIYCVMYLPIVDFLPYKPGNNIPALMAIPDGAQRDSFETRMYYEKNGEVKEFTLQNYPWEDSTWKWVKIDNVLIIEGYKPKIKDLRIADADDNDYSEDFINYPDYQLWVVSHDLSKSNQAAFTKLVAIADEVMKSKKVRTVGLTASNAQATEAFRHENNVAFDFYYCDATTLKTMSRANPGIILLKAGNIIAKWPHRSLKSAADIEQYLK